MNQAWNINKEVKTKEAQIRILRGQATQATVVVSGVKVQTSPKLDRLGDIVLNMDAEEFC